MFPWERKGAMRIPGRVECQTIWLTGHFHQTPLGEQGHGSETMLPGLFPGSFFYKNCLQQFNSLSGQLVPLFCGFFLVSRVCLVGYPVRVEKFWNIFVADTAAFSQRELVDFEKPTTNQSLGGGRAHGFHSCTPRAKNV